MKNQWSITAPPEYHPEKDADDLIPWEVWEERQAEALEWFVVDEEEEEKQ